jgi:hypothetical protein
MLGWSGRALVGSFAVALWMCSVSAHAEEDAATRAAARKLAEDGVLALQNGDAATAAQKLEKAHQMLRVPSVALWSARALAKRGLLIEAAERLREAARLPASGDAAVQEQAKRDAEKELAELTPRIPNLVIRLDGAGDLPVAVTLDGATIPAALLGEDRPVNPGPHHLVGRHDTDERSADVTVAEAERKEVVLRFGSGAAAAPGSAGPDSVSGAVSSDQPASGSGRKTLAFVALGAGAVGLVVGGVTGGLALGKKSALDENAACKDGKCLHSVESDVTSLRTFRTVSTIGFVAGGVLAATGIVLLVTSGGSQERGSVAPPRLAFGVGAGHVRVAGTF